MIATVVPTRQIAPSRRPRIRSGAIQLEHDVVLDLHCDKTAVMCLVSSWEVEERATALQVVLPSSRSTVSLVAKCPTFSDLPYRPPTQVDFQKAASTYPMRKPKTTAARRLLLDRYSRVADGIALLFFPYVEIVIHDLQSQTIAYIANNLSKRELGDDSALEEIDHSAESGTVGPYEKINWDGRRMRCVSTVLFDDAGGAVGVMCVNYNIAVFEDIKHVIDRVISGAGVVKQPEELFKDDWQERINTFLHTWLQERQLALNSLTRDHRREIVEALWAEGAFKGKSAANYVANVLGMGRATVYQHIRDLRGTAI